MAALYKCNKHAIQLYWSGTDPLPSIIQHDHICVYKLVPSFFALHSRFSINSFMASSFLLSSLSGGFLPVRYLVAGVAFLNLSYAYILRLNVNIAIVAMVNYTAIPHVDAAVVSEECRVQGSANQSSGVDDYLQSHSSPVIVFFFGLMFGCFVLMLRLGGLGRWP